MELVYIRRDRKTNTVWIVMVTIASSTNIDYAIIFIQWYGMPCIHPRNLIPHCIPGFCCVACTYSAI